jgi:hypothetical protein
MSMSNQLNNYIASSGAGVDALGRFNISHPLHTGNWRDTAFVQNEMNRMKAMEANEDPQTAMIRALLDQMRMGDHKKLPGNVQYIPPATPAQGNMTYSYQEDNRRG